MSVGLFSVGLAPVGATWAQVNSAGAVLGADCGASGVASAALSTQILLSSAPVGSGTAAADLQAAASATLSANAAGSGVASASLSTSIRLAAAAAGSGVASASLNTSIVLQAAAAGSGIAAGSLSTSITMASAAQGSGIATASLATGSASDIAASAYGSGVASASLLTSILLAASASGSGISSASLSAGADPIATQSYGGGRKRGQSDGIGRNRRESDGPSVEEVLARWELLEAQRADGQAQPPARNPATRELAPAPPQPTTHADQAASVWIDITNPVANRGDAIGAGAVLDLAEDLEADDEMALLALLAEID